MLVVAASVDDQATAQQTADEESLTFAVGHGLEAREMASRLGCFFDADRQFMHATGFLIKPDGTIANAVYSTGSIGRLVAEDALRVIDWYRRKAGEA